MRLERNNDRGRLITKGGYDWTKRYVLLIGPKEPSDFTALQSTTTVQVARVLQRIDGGPFAIAA